MQTKKGTNSNKQSMTVRKKYFLGQKCIHCWWKVQLKEKLRLATFCSINPLLFCWRAAMICVEILIAISIFMSVGSHFLEGKMFRKTSIFGSNLDVFGGFWLLAPLKLHGHTHDHKKSSYFGPSWPPETLDHFWVEVLVLW